MATPTVTEADEESDTEDTPLISGVIFDGNTALPKEGATVNLTDADGNSVAETSTDKGGYYEFTDDSYKCSFG